MQLIIDLKITAFAHRVTVEFAYKQLVKSYCVLLVAVVFSLRLIPKSSTPWQTGTPAEVVPDRVCEGCACSKYPG